MAFVIDHINSDSGTIADRIIRLFGELNAPVSVAISPSSTLGNLSYLINYVDSGIADVSIDGYKDTWQAADVPYQSVSKWSGYDALLGSLSASRDQVKQTFGEAPLTCILPPGHVDEINYTAIAKAGFKVACYTDSNNTLPTQTEVKGFYRLPIIANVAYTDHHDLNKKLLLPPAKVLPSLVLRLLR